MSTPAQLSNDQIDLLFRTLIRQQQHIIDLLGQQTYTSWAILLLFGLLIVLCLGLYLRDRKTEPQTGG